MKSRISGLPVLVIMMCMSAFLVSCTSETCLEEIISTLNAAFYKAGTNTPSAPDSVTVFGIGKDTDRLYSKSINEKTIKLPLDASSSSCGFIIKINGTTDTLRFTYSAYPYLISRDCGISFFYTLNTSVAEGSIIDSVSIRNRNISTFNAENIRIYY